MNPEVKKKYWNDQVKSMVGPCMITFAIPLTIPGITITLVAFSDDQTFPLYGTLHIVGIIILVIAVFLIVFGCILKFVWKPFLEPDIERQLSPLSSFRSSYRGNSIYKNQMDRIQRNNKPCATISNRDNSNRTNKEETAANIEISPDAIQTTSDDFQTMVEQQQDYIEREEETKSKSDNLTMCPSNDLSLYSSPRGGCRLPPIETTPRQPHPRGQEISRRSRKANLSDIESWRKKKKRRKRHSKDRQEVDSDAVNQETGIVNQGSDCEGSNPPSPSKHTKAKENFVDENASGESIKSSNCSLLNEESHDTPRKKKRRKTRKTLTALRQESLEKLGTVDTNPHHTATATLPDGRGIGNESDSSIDSVKISSKTTKKKSVSVNHSD